MINLRIMQNSARVEYFTVQKYLNIFPIISILLLYRTTLKFNNLRIKGILKVPSFIQVKEVKMSLQVKDGKFSPQGLFIVV
jgi:hypothetical protein